MRSIRYPRTARILRVSPILRAIPGRDYQGRPLPETEEFRLLIGVPVIVCRFRIHKGTCSVALKVTCSIAVSSFNSGSGRAVTLTGTSGGARLTTWAYLRHEEISSAPMTAEPREGILTVVSGCVI